MTDRPDSVVVGYFFDTAPPEALDATCIRCGDTVKISIEGEAALRKFELEGRKGAAACFPCAMLMAKEDNDNGILNQHLSVRDYTSRVKPDHPMADDLRDSLVIGVGVNTDGHQANCDCVPVSCMKCAKTTHFGAQTWANMLQLMEESVERNIEVQTLCHACAVKDNDKYSEIVSSRDMFG